MICEHCGHSLPTNDEVAFCTNCGTTIHGQNGKLMKNVYSQMLFSKEKHFIYLLVAVFLMLASFMFYTFYVIITKNPIPSIMVIFFNIVRFILFTGFIHIYFVKVREEKLTLNWKKYLSTFTLTVILWLLLTSLYTIIGLISGALANRITSLMADGSAFVLLIVLGLVILTFILEMIGVSFVMLYYIINKSERRVGDLLVVYRKIIAKIFKKIGFFLIMNLILVVFLYMLVYGQMIFGFLSEFLIPYTFLQKFIQIAFAAFLNAWMLLIIFRIGDEIVLKEFGNELSEMVDKKRIPFYLFIILIPIIATMIIYPLQSKNPHERLALEAEAHKLSGDLLLEIGLDNQAIIEYDIAYSLVMSLKAYYAMIIAVDEKDDLLIEEAEAYFDKSLELYSGNPYTFLFKANIASMDDEELALNLYQKGTVVPDFYPDIMVSGYWLAKKEHEDEVANRFLDWMINNEVFTDSYRKFTTIKIKKIENYMDSLEDIEEELELKMVYKAYRYVEMNQFAVGEGYLLDLHEKYRKDPAVNYYLSRLYNEYRSEQKRYKDVIKYSEKFVDKYNDDSDAGEIEKEIFLAEVYMATDEYDAAEKIYKDLWEENNDNKRIIDKYVYILVKNQKYEQAIDIIEELDDSEYDNNMYFYNAMALLNLGEYKESLDTITNLEFSKEEENEIYDRYMYIYSLAFAHAGTDEEIMKVVDEIDKSILQSYIYAMKAWSTKDLESATDYMDEVLEINDELGYAWYVQGINYYEYAVRNETDDYTDAIKAYQKALKYIPKHVEVYFSLGHAYEKAENHEQADKAFSKVIDLLPKSDHRVDTYGISVHSSRYIE